MRLIVNILRIFHRANNDATNTSIIMQKFYINQLFTIGLSFAQRIFFLYYMKMSKYYAKRIKAHMTNLYKALIYIYFKVNLQL